MEHTPAYAGAAMIRSIALRTHDLELGRVEEPHRILGNRSSILLRDACVVCMSIYMNEGHRRRRVARDVDLYNDARGHHRAIKGEALQPPK